MKFYNFCFTHNNWTEESYADLVSKKYKYLILGKEVAPTTLTPHLQGFVAFKNQRSLAAVIKAFPGCHITPCNGTAQQNIDYCMKENNYAEFGVSPITQAEKGQMEKDRWERARELAKEGRMDEIDSELYIKYISSFKKIRADNELLTELPDTEQQHLWYYGGTGTGKSRTARESNPGLYLKMCNKWWDGYTDQCCVLLEDFDKNHNVLLHHLKIWADRYPFPGEKKGTACLIRPQLIIVTSNYHPRDIWPGENEVLPILRRFKLVHFPGGAQPPPHAPTWKPIGGLLPPNSNRESISEY